MWYAVLLFSHIFAAAATVLLIGAALVVAVRSSPTFYRPLMLTIGLIAGFEIGSGTLLALLSAEVSAAGLASHIALYLGACIVAELALMYRLQERGALFIGATAAPALASLGFFFTALSLGV